MHWPLRFHISLLGFTGVSRRTSHLIVEPSVRGRVNVQRFSPRARHSAVGEFSSRPMVARRVIGTVRTGESKDKFIRTKAC